MNSRAKRAGVRIPALPHTSCVTLGKLMDLSVPQFRVLFYCVLGRLNRLIHLKHLEQCQAQSQYSINPATTSTELKTVAYYVMHYMKV